MLGDSLPVIIYIFFLKRLAHWRPPTRYLLNDSAKLSLASQQADTKQVHRKDHTLIPAIASTTHMIQSAGLEQTFIDLLATTAKTRLSTTIAAYVCLSRMKELRNTVIMQPLYPSLHKKPTYIKTSQCKTLIKYAACKKQKQCVKPLVR